MKTTCLAEDGSRPVAGELWPMQGCDCTEFETAPRVHGDAMPDGFVSITKPFRLHGHSTSVRLETIFWSMLCMMAKRDDVSLAQLVMALHDESLEHSGCSTNFASFLRVTCLHFVAETPAVERNLQEKTGRYRNTTAGYGTSRSFKSCLNR